MAEKESAAVTCKISSKIKFISHNDLKFGTIWHSFRKNPSSPFWGIFGDFSLFMGKKWGCILIANEPSSRPGVKPSSLIIRRHKKYSTFLSFFNSNGEFPGKKNPSKNELCKHTHRCVRLCKIHFLYQERTEAVSLKLTNFIPSTSGVSSPE